LVGKRVETGAIYAELQETNLQDPEATAADAITLAARQVALTIGAAAIVTYTTSGSTALRAARERPACPVVVLTPRLATARRLSLAWGLHCEVTDDASNFAEMVQYASRSVKNMGYGSTGDRIVITAGVPFGTPGSTNILRIARLP